MTAMQTATAFFHACESLKGWEGCKAHVANGATFAAQSEPVADIDTVQGYCEWMRGFGTGPVPGCRYEIHAQAYDENSRTALFFATFTGTHTGDGGPVPPTGRTVQAHYVYALTMNEHGKVAHMVKIWNAPWSLRMLGWAN